MTAESRLENVLRSPQPAQALRALVEDLAREGSSKTQIYKLLERFLAQLRSRHDFRETEEEAVLDVMDALTGWCHSSAELLPDKPMG
jgi:hypothetical protein